MMLYTSQQGQQAMAQNAPLLPAPSSQATTTTNNFLLYDNVTNGFRIEYPSNWQKIEKPLTSSINFISPFESDKDRYKEIIDVSFLGFTNDTSLNDWVNYTINFLNTSFNDFQLLESNATTLAGNPAHKLVYIISHPIFGITKTMLIATMSDNRNIYTITYFTKPNQYDNSLPIAQRMINSFQIYHP
jgi:hypothetical protein